MSLLYFFSALFYRKKTRRTFGFLLDDLRLALLLDLLLLLAGLRRLDGLLYGYSLRALLEKHLFLKELGIFIRLNHKYNALILDRDNETPLYSESSTKSYGIATIYKNYDQISFVKDTNTKKLRLTLSSFSSTASLRLSAFFLLTLPIWTDFDKGNNENMTKNNKIVNRKQEQKIKQWKFDDLADSILYNNNQQLILNYCLCCLFLEKRFVQLIVSKLRKIMFKQAMSILNSIWKLFVSYFEKSLHGKAYQVRYRKSFYS